MKRRLLPIWIFIALLFSIAPFLHASVVANFSPTATSGCSPLTITFRDLSTGNPTSWSWNFGNSNNSSLQNPSAVYNTPGIYTVTLSVSDGATNSQASQIITVYGKPLAAFTVTPAVACAGSLITFHDNSTPGSGPISTWKWDFGDGIAQTTGAGGTSHTYNAPGTFPASLIVTDSHGCTSNIVSPVTINPVPKASFTASPLSGCTAPLLVNFTNTTPVSGSVTYAWSFGDGSISAVKSPSHNYTAPGIYAVKMVVNENGCSDSITKSGMIIIQKIVADFGSDTTKICEGQAINFTDLSIPSSASRTWMFGDGATSAAPNPSHIYASAGIYTVSFQATDASSCVDTKTKNAFITVYKNPKPGFTLGNAIGCSLPFAVTFSDTTSGAVSWNWSFGDGGSSLLQNPVHTYTAAGTYTVSLTVKNANGCSAVITKNALVKIVIPVVKFSATPRGGCAPVIVNFSDSSTSSVPIVSWVWDFGNGNMSTTTVPSASALYSLPGVFNVKLKIITNSGCIDSLVKIGYVKTGVKPVADFSYTPDTICYGQTVQFKDLSVNANGWLWIYGDGGKDTIQNPLHLYSDTGTFTVNLIAKNNGCPDTITKLKIITVNPPIPNFITKLSCTNYFTVGFLNTSVGADSITWDFGDGTFDFSNTNNPVHTYATRGAKTVKLTAFNRRTKCSFFTSSTFTIAQPIASFTTAPSPPYGCVPFTVGFSNTSQDASSNAWAFGDGSGGVVTNPSMTYGNIGVYTIKLTVTDVNGCTNTVKDTNMVHALGIRSAGFFCTPLTGCAPLLTTFTDTSKADSVLVRRTWNWGDGSPSTVVSGAVVTHTYPKRGIYTVTMTVQDTNGCIAIVGKANYINPTKPYPTFSVDTFSCKGNVLSFDASATTLIGAAPASYTWLFGDGSPAITTPAAVVTHAYATDNTFSVTLTVSDANGCDSTIKKKILILQPKAAFRDSVVSYGCGTEQVQFINQSTGYVNSWFWDFGNGATSLLPNPLYTYTHPGVYKVKLIILNQGGCMDTIVKDSLVVVPGPIGSFTFSPTRGCVPLTVNFVCNSGNATYFTWDFGDGTVLPKTNQHVVSHTYIRNLMVTPILLLGDTLPNGTVCELPATNLTGNVITTQVLNVIVAPASPINIYEDNYIPLITTVSGGSGNFSYSWTPTVGLTCDTCPNPVLSAAGQSLEYYVTVHDRSPGGCSNMDSVSVVFLPCDLNTLIPNVFTPNSDGVNDVLYVNGLCTNTNFMFTVYDRWGVIMFQTDKRGNGWDGRTIAGGPAQDGIYYYIITINDKLYKGYVELIR
jgi:gliding motility-associated-like protein